MDYFSLAGAEVQVYANLLSIWPGSFQKIWTAKRFLAYCKTDKQVPSLGRAWI